LRKKEIAIKGCFHSLISEVCISALDLGIEAKYNDDNAALIVWINDICLENNVKERNS
jgi:hypothetical protein